MPENNDVPQFQTAEFHEPPGADACCICHQPVSGSYYRIGGAMACAACSQQVLARKPADSHAAFVRAIFFGLGGALLGLILYSGVGILFHLEVGYVSLAVGYIVGKLMMMGSANIGGRRYQWIAVALTYAAVSLSVIPVSIAQYIQERPQHAQAQHAQGEPQAQQAQGGPQDSTPGARSAAPAKFQSLGKVVAILVMYGLASPFLGLMGNPLSGALGIIILLVGVRIAWQITAGVRLPAIEGPY